MSENGATGLDGGSAPNGAVPPADDVNDDLDVQDDLDDGLDDVDESSTAGGSDSSLTVRTDYTGGITRLIAAGEIDASSANTFEAAANQAIDEQPTTIEIDLSGVEFIDSSGLRAIIALNNRAKEMNIDAALAGLSPAAQRVLEITGLIDTLKRR